MNIIFLLVPISLIFITCAIFAFKWAIKARQFDDMKSPAFIPLLDDEDEKK